VICWRQFTVSPLDAGRPLQRPSRSRRTSTAAPPGGGRSTTPAWGIAWPRSRGSSCRRASSSTSRGVSRRGSGTTTPARLTGPRTGHPPPNVGTARYALAAKIVGRATDAGRFVRVTRAFHEFRRQVPRLAPWWLLTSAGVFPVGLIYGFSAAEALAFAVSMVPRAEHDWRHVASPRLGQRDPDSAACRRRLQLAARALLARGRAFGPSAVDRSTAPRCRGLSADGSFRSSTTPRGSR
jgi:hypothetical protein